MAGVRGVRGREDQSSHGVRGGFPPKGGKPHHPHGRQSDAPHGTPLTLVRSLRQDRTTLTGEQIDHRLIEIEQSLRGSLSVDDVVRITGEKPDTIHKAISRGQLAASRSSGSNMWQLEPADVDAWNRRPRRRRTASHASQSDLVRSH